MEELEKIISDSFYTQPLMLLSALMASIIGIVRRKRIKEFRLLIAYPIASFIQGLVAFFYWVNSTENEQFEVDVISENIFILIESLIIYFFFKKIIVLKRIRIYIHVVFSIYILYLLSLWVFTNAFFFSPYKMYLIESVVTLSFCFLYLFQLFSLPPSVNLLESPAFWMTIGCLFYFSCTIPLFFADSVLNIVPVYHSLYSINFLAYTVLFLFISKAFLCDPAQTKQRYS